MNIYQENPRLKAFYKKKQILFLIKYSSKPISFWEDLQKKELPAANLPIKYDFPNDFERKDHPNCQTKLYLPYLKNFQTLKEETVTKNFKTKDLLLLAKQNLELLKKLHNQGVTHGDLVSTNLMINDKKELYFIDFDEATISGKDFSKRKKEDKLRLLLLYLNYLRFGRFTDNHWLHPNSFILPENIKKQLIPYYFEGKNPKKEDYFEELMDEMIDQEYEAPKLKNRHYE